MDPDKADLLYPDREELELGMNLYEEQIPDRLPYMLRAREASRLTDRTLFPYPGEKPIAAMVNGVSSVGQRSVDFLAALFLSVMFPPNVEVVRLEADPVLARLATGMKKGKIKLDAQLSLYSEKLAIEIDNSRVRSPMVTTLKHLFVGGTTGFYFGERGPARHISLENFVLERDPFARMLRMVVCEYRDVRSLSQAAREALAKSEKYKKSISLPSSSDGSGVPATMISARRSYARLFTIIEALPRKNELDSLRYRIRQEIEDEPIPGATAGPFDELTCPYMAFGYQWCSGENYARSRVEQYSGNLNSIEGFAQAILEMAATLSKLLVARDPSGLVSREDLINSRTGDIVESRFEAGKPVDFAIVQPQGGAGLLREPMELLGSMSQETSKDFGLSFIPRGGERVTATETQIVAQQIDRGMGGGYSHFSQEIQLPVFYRAMHRIEARGEAPVFPMRDKKTDSAVIRPRIITGHEALGRGNDALRLNEAIEILGKLGQIPEQVLARMDLDSWVKMVCLSKGISPESALLEEETIQAQSSNAQLMALLQKLGPEAIRQIGAARMAGGASSPASPQTTQVA